MTRSQEASDEMLMALADGELDGAAANRLRMMISGDARLAARYAQFEHSRAALQDAFVAEPVPAALIATIMAHPAPAVEKTANVVPLRRVPAVAWAGWGVALAACVVLAANVYGAGAGGAGAAGNIGLATAGLATGAEITLPDGTGARVLASYDTDRGLCRMIAQGDLRHISCRDAQSGDWQLALTVPGGDAGGFLPASDFGVATIDGLLDTLGAGPALDAAGEQRALSR